MLQTDLRLEMRLPLRSQSLAKFRWPRIVKLLLLLCMWMPLKPSSLSLISTDQLLKSDFLELSSQVLHRDPVVQSPERLAILLKTCIQHHYQLHSTLMSTCITSQTNWSTHLTIIVLWHQRKDEVLQINWRDTQLIITRVKNYLLLILEDSLNMHFQSRRLIPIVFNNTVQVTLQSPMPPLVSPVESHRELEVTPWDP